MKDKQEKEEERQRIRVEMKGKKWTSSRCLAEPVLGLKSKSVGASLAYSKSFK